MFELVPPSPELFNEWSAAHEEWGPGFHEDGFGISPSDDVKSPAGFQAWINRLDTLSQPDDQGLVSIFRWVLEGGGVAGGIALRYGNDKVTDKLGHIGFGVTPSARGRGVGSWALQQMRTLASELAISPIVLVCRSDNEPSIRTIAAAGGELASVPNEDGLLRFRIDPH